MAFEKEQTLLIESKRNVKSDQFESTSRIEVQAEKPIKRVVSVNAMAKVTSKEKVGEVLNFAGKTTYQVTYQTEDNLFASATAFVEWSGKLDDVKEENLVLKAGVIANTVTDFSSTEIAISSLVNVEVFAIVKDEIQTVENLSDDYVKLEKNYNYNRVVNFVSDSFNEVSEVEMQDVVSDVLFACGNATVNNVACGIDAVTLDGTIFVYGAYVKDGKVEQFNKNIDFKHEFSALSVVPNNIADANVNVENVIVTASVSETDQKTNMIFSVDLSADVAVYESNSVSLIQDAFSVTKETENVYECVSAYNFEAMQNYQENLVLSIAMPEISQELAYIAKADVEVTDKTRTDNGTIINGAVAVETLSLDKENNAILDRTFAPFSVLVPDAEENCEFSVVANILSAKQKINNEVDLECGLTVTYKSVKTEYIGFVKSIEEKEDKQVSSSAIRVYVTKEGEDLFAVAKAISTRPETILEQNPGVSDVFDAGTRLVIYNGLNLNF